MIQEIMRYVNNFFCTGTREGQYSISGNALNVPVSGLVYISGSLHHDGVWQVCRGLLQDMSGNLPDEEFNGNVYFLDPPRDFLQLCEEIRQYTEKNPVGAYQSESFGGYSYNRGNAAGQGWQTVFAVRLRPYRKMFSEI